MNPLKTIIAITGMPGAGKAIASELARNRGIPVLVCGDVVREEASKRQLSPTPENLGRLMLEIRNEEGLDVIANRLVPKIMSSQSTFFIVEGLRNIEELEKLRTNFKIIVLGIHSSQNQRFQRLLRRKRSDDPTSFEDFIQRDRRELNVGIGSVIALADKLIVNDSTIDAFKLKLIRFYEEVNM